MQSIRTQNHCAGLTGKTGTFHTEQALAYHGTQMVAGTHPKKVAKPGRVPMVKIYPCSALLPKQKTVLERCVSYLCATRGCRRGYCESIDAEVELITCITEGVPVLDMVQVKAEQVQFAPDRTKLSRIKLLMNVNWDHATKHFRRFSRCFISLRHIDL